MNVVEVQAQKRQEVGKKAVKATKASGFIPAVIYGNEEPESVSVELKDLRALVYTPDFKLADVTIGGSTTKCIVKEVQYHPVSDEILHVDFLRLKDGVPVKVNVPVRFRGVSPGVKVGGKLIQQMRKVAIKTTPDKLVDVIYADISGMELGGVLRVKQLEINDGIDVMVNSSIPVANIEIPRALKSAAAAEAKAAAGAKKKK